MSSSNKLGEIFEIPVKTIDGRTTSLSEYRGKAMLVVNVASRCGFTPQYEGLEKLYRSYQKKGLVILAFPCNQFGKQEPGSDSEIKTFCSTTYGVSFPLFAKVDVNGANTHPLYLYLKNNRRGLLGFKGIKWNFTKFLIDGKGRVVARFGPSRKPESLARAVEKVLSI